MRKEIMSERCEALAPGAATSAPLPGSLLADLAKLIARAVETGDLALARALLDAQGQSAQPAAATVIDIAAERARRS